MGYWAGTMLIMMIRVTGHQCFDKVLCKLDTDKCECFVGHYNDAGEVR